MPTKLCFLLSHKGAAHIPLVARGVGGSFLHLQGNIKYKQIGSCGNQVIAVMRLHKRSVHAMVAFWGPLRMLIFQSWKLSQEVTISFARDAGWILLL